MKKHNTLATNAFFLLLIANVFLCQGIAGREMMLQRSSNCQHCRRRETCETDCHLPIGEVETITCWVRHCTSYTHNINIHRVEVEGERVIIDNNTLPGLQELRNDDGCSLHLTYVITPDINGTLLLCSAVDSTGRLTYSKSIRIGVQADSTTATPSFPSPHHTSPTAPNDTTTQNSSVGIDSRKVELNRSSSCQYCQHTDTCETDCRQAIGVEETITCWVPHCNAHSHTLDFYRVEVEGERVIRDSNTLPGLQRLWNPDGCSLHLTYVVTPDINGIALQCSAVRGTSRPIYSKSIIIGVQAGTDSEPTDPPITAAIPTTISDQTNPPTTTSTHTTTDISGTPGSTSENSNSAAQTLTYCTITILILAGLSVFVAP